MQEITFFHPFPSPPLPLTPLHPKPLGFLVDICFLAFLLNYWCWLVFIAIGGADMFGSGVNLITTVIGFGLSATFILFVCTRLLCGRIRGSDSAAFELDSNTDLEQPEQTIRGLEPTAVASIPKMKFNKEAFESKEDAQCSICLGEYQDKDILRVIPNCGHVFHLSCIDVWLHKQSTCPVCRLPLHDKSLKTQMRSVPIVAPTFQSIDSPDITSDHSQQWLLPGPERSLHNESNQGQQESLGGILVPPVSRERNTEIVRVIGE